MWFSFCRGNQIKQNRIFLSFPPHPAGSSPIMPQVSFAHPSLCLNFLPLLHHLLPSNPPTVRDVDVPPLFRERFILTGYRPTGMSWRCYALSLFQIHNETLNVWSHLLAAAFVVLRFMVFAIMRGGVGYLQMLWSSAAWWHSVWLPVVWPLTY